MRETTLAFDQNIQSMLTVSRHDHIRFPVSIRSSRVRGLRALFYGCSVLDPLAGLPIRPLGSPFSMVTRESANQVLSTTIDVLIDRFVTNRGQLVLMLEASGD
jgi:hypothetical protein